MNIPKHYLSKKLFFYHNGIFFRVSEHAFIAVNVTEFLDATLPILVVARDNLTESVNKYPVTDRNDLRAIIKQERRAYSMVSEATVKENYSLIKLWHPDEEFTKQLDAKFFIWLPESMLLEQFSEHKLFKIHRCGGGVFTFNDLNANYTVACKGPYVSSNYFLMSIGAPSVAQTEISETEYAQCIYTQIVNVEKKNVVSVLQAQEFIPKLKTGFNWPSILVGTACGITLYYLSIISYLAFQESILKADIVEQKITSVVGKKQEILNKRKVFAEFATQDVSDNFELQMWHLLGEIMKEKISVVKVRTNEQGIWIRLQSKVATESLKFIKSLPMVESASFANAVQNFRGEQRFNLDVTFNNAANNKEIEAGETVSE